MTTYLADKSAWMLRSKNPRVDERFLDLIAKGRLGCCEMVALELLYSARDAEDFERISNELTSLVWFPVDNTIMRRALDVQHILLRVGHHRRPIPDLIIAATAEHHRAAVLHNDKDFELIAAVTHQAVEYAHRHVDS